MSSVANWPVHERDLDPPDPPIAIAIGTPVLVVPITTRSWRAIVVSDMPHEGKTRVIATEPGRGWSREELTVKRDFIRRHYGTTT